ncbi:tryptophan-rich antigen [Plasmodium gonderi]|uniref:Tryptophan-rich antigen n=1 Tax=Plasmodium gonderi TaxID=77519 RepID=A0A1Y1JD38_PLAGO|nr:tryptophan-rich antigen [Plasmodium gonderi]GAW79598.1 tryptophan-rich antigen [Plasmodium gonderi]
MASPEVLEYFLGTEEVVPTIKQYYSDIFSKKNANLLMSAASSALLYLSSGPVFPNCLPSTPLCSILGDALNTSNEIAAINTPMMEKLRDNKWNEWMNQLEEQWKNFHDQIENERRQWLEKKDNEWDEWKKKMEVNYTNYCKDIDNEFESNSLKDSEKWDSTQWEDWIRTVGRKMIEGEYENWVHKNEKYLDKWIVTEWFGWKKNKISSWLSSEWKCKENESWSQWEETPLAKLLFIEDRKKWTAWKERILKEKDEWNKWVDQKEYAYINNEWNPWKKWKNKNRLSFKKWIGSFIDEWISNKQWNELLQERKKFVIAKKSFQLIYNLTN